MLAEHDGSRGVRRTRRACASSVSAERPHRSRGPAAAAGRAGPRCSGVGRRALGRRRRRLLGRGLGGGRRQRRDAGVPGPAGRVVRLWTTVREPRFENDVREQRFMSCRLRTPRRSRLDELWQRCQNLQPCSSEVLYCSWRRKGESPNAAAQ